MSHLAASERFASWSFRWALLLFGPLLIHSRWAVRRAARRILTRPSAIDGKENARRPEKEACAQFLQLLYEDNANFLVLIECTDDPEVWEALSRVDDIVLTDNEEEARKNKLGFEALALRILHSGDFDAKAVKRAVDMVIARAGSVSAALLDKLNPELRHWIWNSVGVKDQLGIALELIRYRAVDDPVFQDAMRVIKNKRLLPLLRARDAEVRSLAQARLSPFGDNKPWMDLLFMLDEPVEDVLIRLIASGQ